jgi:hypothetical protein
MTPPETGTGGTAGSATGTGGDAAGMGGSAAGGSAVGTGGSATGAGGSSGGSSGGVGGSGAAGIGGNAGGSGGSAAGAGGSGGSAVGAGGAGGGTAGSAGGRGGMGGRGGFGGRGGSGGRGGTGGANAGSGGNAVGGTGGANAGSGGSAVGGTGGANAGSGGSAVGGTGGASAGSGGSAVGGTGGTSGPLGLIAFWRFDEGSGSTIADATGNGQALTLSASGFDWTSFGHLNAGVLFDGATGYAQVTPQSGQPLLSYPVMKLTLAAWVQTDISVATPAFATAVGRAHEDFLFQDFWLGLAGGKPACIIHDPNWQGAVASTAVSPGTWTHIACTYATSGDIELYVNGTAVASASSTEGLGPIPTRILVGAAETDKLQAFFPGGIDDVRIYNDTLTPAQVMAIAH